MTEEIQKLTNEIIKLTNKIQILQQKTDIFIQNYSDGTEFLTTYSTEYKQRKLEAEIVLDKVDQSYKHINEILSISKETKEKYEKRMNQFIELCEEKKKLIVKNNNLIIEEMNLLDEKLIKDVELRKIQKRQNEMLMKEKQEEEQNEEIEKLKEELQREKAKQLERFNLSIDEKNQLEEWTGRKIKEVIFNSDFHDWNTNTSVFGAIVMDKPKVILMIEDTNGNKFGGYISSRIDKYYKRRLNILYGQSKHVRNQDKYISDSNAFVFSLQSNGRMNQMMRFLLKYYKYAYCQYNINNDWLFSIGHKDISIYKQHQNQEPFGYCHQSSFFYHSSNYTLCDKGKFIIKRFFVVQMK